MNSKINLFLLFVILTLGIILRSQETVSRNFVFLIDQGRDMMAVKSILYDHHMTLIGPYTSLQGVFQGPIWYYLLSIFTFIFRGDPWGSVVFMFVISVLVMIVTYIYSKKLFGIRTAFLTLFFLAISPEAIAAATYSWNPHPMWLLLSIYIYLFYLVTQGNISKFIFLWPLIALMFHFETALAVFIFAATIIYFLIYSRKLLYEKYSLLGFLISIVFFLPQILFDFRHDFLMTNSVINIFKGSKQGLMVTGESKDYIELMKSHLSTFFINLRSVFPQIAQVELLSSLFLMAMTFVFFFKPFFNIFSKNERNFITVIGRLIIILFLLSFLYPFPIRYWFLTGFQMFYIFIIGIIFSNISRIMPGKIIISCIIVVFIIHTAGRINLLYINPPDDGGVVKVKGKTEAIRFIYEDAKGKPFNLFVFTPPVNPDAYDYLIWWIGNKEYSYVPEAKKEGTFYLLMEPDPNKPWSYKGWMETVIKTGTIEKTKELPSGFIIQKRVI